MTEQEWLECTNPQRLLEHLSGQAGERKLRLFAAAACRRLWYLHREPPLHEAVSVAERYADGLATAEEVGRAAGEVMPLWISGWYDDTVPNVVFYPLAT